MPRNPTDLYLNRWLDSGKGLFTTDYLFAFDSQRTYIFNAGILRSGGNPDRPARGVPSASLPGSIPGIRTAGVSRARISLDGTTIIDSSAAMAQRDSGAVAANRAAIKEAQSFHQSQHATSSVIRVTEPGYYRIDFWSVCRDLNDKQATYNLTNELGNRVEKRGIFSTRMQRLESFYNGDSQVTAVQKHRYETNPVKQVIAENHSTMFDLVLENVETGEKGRVNGDNIWHNADYSPVEKLEYQAVMPTGEGAFESSDWVFTGSAAI